MLRRRSKLLFIPGLLLALTLTSGCYTELNSIDSGVITGNPGNGGVETGNPEGNKILASTGSGGYIEDSSIPAPVNSINPEDFEVNPGNTLVVTDSARLPHIKYYMQFTIDLLSLSAVQRARYLFNNGSFVGMAVLPIDINPLSYRTTEGVGTFPAGTILCSISTLYNGEEYNNQRLEVPFLLSPGQTYLEFFIRELEFSPTQQDALSHFLSNTETTNASRQRSQVIITISFSIENTAGEFPPVLSFDDPGLEGIDFLQFKINRNSAQTNTTALSDPEVYDIIAGNRSPFEAALWATFFYTTVDGVITPSDTNTTVSGEGTVRLNNNSL